MLHLEEPRNPPARALAMLTRVKVVAPQARLVFFHDGEERGYAVVVDFGDGDVVMSDFVVEEYND